MKTLIKMVAYMAPVAAFVMTLILFAWWFLYAATGLPSFHDNGAMALFFVIGIGVLVILSIIVWANQEEWDEDYKPPTYQDIERVIITPPPRAMCELCHISPVWNGSSRFCRGCLER